MSDAEQFMGAVPERSVPRDWRGGLERSGARRGRVGRQRGRLCAMNGGPERGEASYWRVSAGGRRRLLAFDRAR
jgi:hypothetical protein